MLIGAPHRTDLVGRAYLYQKDYKDRWQLIEKIFPGSDNWTSDFGSQVKINDQHILIADQKFNQEKGSVFTMKLNLNTDRWELGNILSYEKMNQDGFFGEFGGQFVPETLYPAIDQLNQMYRSLKNDNS